MPIANARFGKPPPGYLQPIIPQQPMTPPQLQKPQTVQQAGADQQIINFAPKPQQQQVGLVIFKFWIEPFKDQKCAYKITNSPIKIIKNYYFWMNLMNSQGKSITSPPFHQREPCIVENFYEFIFGTNTSVLEP